MNRFYDDFEKVSCQTAILAEKDGYYTFEDTVFYGEKGGQLSDRGTINGLPVLDLRWEADRLWHRVEGRLQDPIVMEVDRETRWINTTVQTLFHLLDGFYEKKGLAVTAVHAKPGNQWYEIKSKELSDDLLTETEDFIRQVIKDELPVTISYQDGKDYPDPAYQHFRELRLVQIGDINTQPCGTCHVHHTGQIGSFAILGREKTSKGWRIQIAVGDTVSQTLKEDRQLLSHLAGQLSSKRASLGEKTAELLQAKQDLKKAIQTLKKQVWYYQAQALLQTGQAVIECKTDEAGDLAGLSQILSKKVSQDTLIWAEIGGWIYFNLLSPEGAARDLFEKLQQCHSQLKGGGSVKIVSGKIELDRDSWMQTTAVILAKD